MYNVPLDLEHNGLGKGVKKKILENHFSYPKAVGVGVLHVLKPISRIFIYVYFMSTCNL